MRKRYPSDISKEQFELILPDLESARKKNKPRKIAPYQKTWTPSLKTLLPQDLLTQPIVEPFYNT